MYVTEVTAELHGADELKVAIRREYDLELGKLPSVYTSYFLSPPVFILDKPTSYIKRWFLLVRSGR